jgi:hypothetical protein
LNCEPLSTDEDRKPFEKDDMRLAIEARRHSLVQDERAMGGQRIHDDLLNTSAIQRRWAQRDYIHTANT